MMLFLLVLTVGFFTSGKRGFRVGITNKDNPSDINRISDDKVSLAGLSNKGYVLTTVNDVINWSRTGSLYWMTFGLACCAVEMMHTSIPKLI